MKKYITCKYCKKGNRLACLFMKIRPHRYAMCHFCQTSARAGKKRVGTKWVGERTIKNRETRNEYYRNYRKRKQSAWIEAWLMS